MTWVNSTFRPLLEFCKALICISTKKHPHKPPHLTSVPFLCPWWRKASPISSTLHCTHNELVWRLIKCLNSASIINQSEQQIIALWTIKKDRLSFCYWFQQLYHLYFYIFLLSKFSTCTSLKDKKKAFVGALCYQTVFHHNPPASPGWFGSCNSH